MLEVGAVRFPVEDFVRADLNYKGPGGGGGGGEMAGSLPIQKVGLGRVPSAAIDIRPGRRVDDDVRFPRPQSRKCRLVGKVECWPGKSEDSFATDLKHRVQLPSQLS